MSQNEEPTCHRQYESFEVLQGRVARPSYIGRREEAKNILCGLWELPELRSVLD